MKAQAKEEFRGFKCPLATLKSPRADGKSVSLKALHTVKEIEKALKGMISDDSMGNSCLQKFVKCTGGRPMYARTTWARDGRRASVRCCSIESKYPYLSNIAVHLDSLSLKPQHAKILNPSAPSDDDDKGDDERFENLKAEATTVSKSLVKRFGKTFRLDVVTLDWSLSSEGEWNVTNVLDVRGHAAPLANGGGGAAPEPSAAPPKWVLRSAPRNAAKVRTLPDGRKVNGASCAGDFCLLDLPDDAYGDLRSIENGKAVVSTISARTVLGRSIVKARIEVGLTPSTEELMPSRMNKANYVCSRCYERYKSLDVARMEKAREAMSREEAREVEIQRMKSVKGHGWKSAVQVKLENDLEAEREKVKALIRDYKAISTSKLKKCLKAAAAAPQPRVSVALAKEFPKSSLCVDSKIKKKKEKEKIANDEERANSRDRQSASSISPSNKSTLVPPSPLNPSLNTKSRKASQLSPPPNNLPTEYPPATKEEEEGEGEEEEFEEGGGGSGCLNVESTFSTSLRPPFPSSPSSPPSPTSSLPPKRLAPPPRYSAREDVERRGRARAGYDTAFERVKRAIFNK